MIPNQMITDHQYPESICIYAYGRVPTENIQKLLTKPFKTNSKEKGHFSQ